MIGGLTSGEILYQYIRSCSALAEQTLKTWKLVGQETKLFLFSMMVNS